MPRLGLAQGGDKVTHDQIFVTANQAVRERMRDILDWTPEAGMDELEQKAQGVCEEMTLLVDRVRRELGDLRSS